MQYDYNALYGQADTTAGQMIEEGNYDAVVETAEWGSTKSGDKGQWTVRFRITTGARAGTPITTSITVSPTTNDGAVNDRGMGIMFNQLGALGVPVPPNQPFWALGWSEAQVAQAMVGRPVQIRVTRDEDYGNNKIRRITAARPGAPTDWPRQQAPQGFGQPGQFGGAQPMVNGAYASVGMQPPQQAPQQPQQGPYGQPNAPWNPMAAQQPQGGQDPWAAQQQPPQAPPGFQPGQGGPMQEFTPQGQTQQPWMQAQAQQQPPAQPGYGVPPGPQPGQPSPWNGGPQAPAQMSPGPTPAQGYPQGPGGAPAGQPASYPSSAPAWAQGQPQQGQYGQPPQGPQGYQQGPPPQDGQGGQPPQGGPAMPPWAQ